MPREGECMKFIFYRNSKELNIDRICRFEWDDNMCKLIPKSVNLDGKKWKKSTYMKKAQGSGLKAQGKDKKREREEWNDGKPEVGDQKSAQPLARQGGQFDRTGNIDREPI
jgi:hypothetical protein